jgi:hypothetical protein
MDEETDRPYSTTVTVSVTICEPTGAYETGGA